MSEINYSNREEVLEGLKKEIVDVYKIDESLISDKSFLKEAVIVEPFLYEVYGEENPVLFKEMLEGIAKKESQERLAKLKEKIERACS